MPRDSRNRWISTPIAGVLAVASAVSCAPAPKREEPLRVPATVSAHEPAPPGMTPIVPLARAEDAAGPHGWTSPPEEDGSSGATLDWMLTDENEPRPFFGGGLVPLPGGGVATSAFSSTHKVSALTHWDEAGIRRSWQNHPRVLGPLEATRDGALYATAASPETNTTGDLSLLQFDPTLHRAWERTVKGEATRLAVNGEGQALVVLRDVHAAPLASLTLFDRDGRERWTVPIHATGEEYTSLFVQAAAVDARGRFMLVAEGRGRIDWKDQRLGLEDSPYTLLLTLSEDGSPLEHRLVPGGWGTVSALATDEAGRIAVLGRIIGTLEHAGVTITQPPNEAGAQRPYLLVLDGLQAQTGALLERRTCSQFPGWERVSFLGDGRIFLTCDGGAYVVEKTGWMTALPVAESCESSACELRIGDHAVGSDGAIYVTGAVSQKRSAGTYDRSHGFLQRWVLTPH